MKYKLQCVDLDLYGKETGTVTTHEFIGYDLSDMLSHYEQFLKGCGFQFDGELDIVNDIEETFSDPDFSEDPVEHSQHYFDTERNK